MIESHKNYRDSHSKTHYGKKYNQTYSHGYYHDQWHKLEKPLLQELFSELKSDGASTYLDFACGTGRITAVAENYFDDCYGVDVSQTMLDEAKQTVGKATLIHQDITKQPIDQKFDIITAFRFFLNAESSLRDDSLKAISKMLDDEGVLVVNIHVNSHSPLGYVYRLRNMLMSSKRANTLAFSEFEKILQTNNFKIEQTIWYSYLPRPGWKLNWLSRYLMLPIEKLCTRIHFFPKKMAQCFIVVCRKDTVTSYVQ